MSADELDHPSTPRTTGPAEVRPLPDEIAALFPFEPRWIRTPDDRAWQHYVDEGPTDPAVDRDSCPTVLCVHGNPTWSFYWRRLLADLRGRARVIAVDHVGMGRSEKPQDYEYRLATHVANLRHLVTSLDLRRIVLVAHDWGGAIGSGVAVAEPDRFAKLAYLNTAAFPVNRMPRRIAIGRIPWIGGIGIRHLNLFARLATTQGTANPPALRESGASRGLLWPYDSHANRVAIHRFVQDIPMSPNHPTWPTLSGIDTGLGALIEKPVWLGWGMQDWCFSPDPYIEEWTKRFPGATVERYPDAGHYVMEDAATPVSAALQRFVHEVATPTTGDSAEDEDQ